MGDGEVTTGREDGVMKAGYGLGGGIKGGRCAGQRAEAVVQRHGEEARVLNGLAVDFL
jgi:hypothetical protein